MTALDYHHQRGRISGSSAGHALRWGAGALCALTVHAGAAWWVTRPAPPLPVGEAAPAALEIDVSLLGFAAADQVSSGEELDAVEPVPPDTTDVSEVSPVEPVEERPVTPPAVTQPDVTQPVPREAPRPPTEATEAQPVAPTETPIETPDVVAPSDVQIAAAPPTSETEPVEDIAESVQPVEEVAIPDEAPRPTPRPEPVQTAQARPQPQQTRPAPRAEQPRPQPQREAGNRGQNSSDARQGQAEGSAAGRANAAQARGNAQPQGAGSAAVSNYPGQVVAKLRRSLRYPRGARDRGEVHVAFTVSGNGGVNGVSIARSSGFSVLDQAALETVRRAAPFPAIPPDAGRSSWSFTVPLAFTR